MIFLRQNEPAQYPFLEPGYYQEEVLKELKQYLKPDFANVLRKLEGSLIQKKPRS